MPEPGFGEGGSERRDILGGLAGAAEPQPRRPAATRLEPLVREWLLDLLRKNVAIGTYAYNRRKHRPEMLTWPIEEIRAFLAFTANDFDHALA